MRFLAPCGAIIILWGAGLGCAGNPMPLPTDDLGRMERARSDFEAGRYREVIYNLEDFLGARPGSKYVEEATYLMGKALYERGLDLDAEDQFRKVLREFPGGNFSCDANYYLALTLLAQARSPHLDQTERRAALSQFNTFINRCPDHELVDRARKHIADIQNALAEKIWLSGHQVYRKRGFREAERFYYQRVIDEYPDSIWVERAMLGMMRSYEKDGMWLRVACTALRIQMRYPDTPAAEEAGDALGEARREGVDVDNLDCEERQGEAAADTAASGSG